MGHKKYSIFSKVHGEISICGIHHNIHDSLRSSLRDYNRDHNRTCPNSTAARSSLDLPVVPVDRLTGDRDGIRHNICSGIHRIRGTRRTRRTPIVARRFPGQLDGRPADLRKSHQPIGGRASTFRHSHAHIHIHHIHHIYHMDNGPNIAPQYFGLQEGRPPGNREQGQIFRP